MEIMHFCSILRGKSLLFTEQPYSLYEPRGFLQLSASQLLNDYVYSHKDKEPHKCYSAAHSGLHRQNQKRAPKPAGNDYTRSSYFGGLQIRPEGHRLLELKQIPLLLYHCLTLTLNLQRFRPHMMLLINSSVCRTSVTR